MYDPEKAVMCSLGVVTRCSWGRRLVKRSGKTNICVLRHYPNTVSGYITTVLLSVTQRN